MTRSSTASHGRDDTLSASRCTSDRGQEAGHILPIYQRRVLVGRIGSSANLLAKTVPTEVISRPMVAGGFAD
jgi:hypothetical protein